MDFERMLALLVRTVEDRPPVRIRPNPGDWGIDVLVGDLNDRALIWQAKFFIREFGPSQCGQVRSSFRSAMEAAARLRYGVERWTLCVPCSMDASTVRWWQGWTARQEAEHGVRMELWDETELRRLLLRPQADDVRRAYYEPYLIHREEHASATEVALPVNSKAADRDDPDLPWHRGDELRPGGHRYVLLEDADHYRVTGGGALMREADADQIEPRTGGVWLRQVRVASSHERSGSAGRERDGLRAQARLLSRLEGVPDMPRLLAVHEEAEATTLVIARPPGPTWREHYPPGVAGTDRLLGAAVLAVALPLCVALHELHRCGLAHGALTSASILVIDRGRRAVIRDLGRAGTRVPRDELAPSIDVLQLAAIIYETFTGRAASATAGASVRAMGARVPRALDELLTRALAAGPRRQSGTMLAFASGLRAARATLSKGVGM